MRTSLVATVAVAVAACNTPAPPAWSTYVRALKKAHAGETDAAGDLCPLITDRDLYDDCMLAVTRARQTPSTCQKYFSREARGACWLLQAERATEAQTWKDAAEACDQASPYHRGCFDRVWRARALDIRGSVSEELQALTSSEAAYRKTFPKAFWPEPRAAVWSVVSDEHFAATADIDGRICGALKGTASDACAEASGRAVVARLDAAAEGVDDPCGRLAQAAARARAGEPVPLPNEGHAWLSHAALPALIEAAERCEAG